MKRVRIYPYKMASRGANVLQQALSDAGVDDVLRVRPDGDYRPQDNDLIINWGCGYEPSWKYNPRQMLNLPSRICRSVDKLETFNYCLRHNVPVPEWTEQRIKAADWLAFDEMILARMNEGYDGNGLQIIHRGEYLPYADFYTRILPIHREWRIGVIQGQVVTKQMKVRIRDSKDERENLIRVGSSGWGFTYDHPPTPDSVCKVAADAAFAIGLDIVGADVGELRAPGGSRAVLLEVNTAPELTLHTAARFANNIVQRFV